MLLGLRHAVLKLALCAELARDAFRVKGPFRAVVLDLLCHGRGELSLLRDSQVVSHSVPLVVITPERKVCVMHAPLVVVVPHLDPDPHVNNDLCRTEGDGPIHVAVVVHVNAHCVKRIHGRVVGFVLEGHLERDEPAVGAVRFGLDDLEPLRRLRGWKGPGDGEVFAVVVETHPSVVAELRAGVFELLLQPIGERGATHRDDARHLAHVPFVHPTPREGDDAGRRRPRRAEIRQATSRTDGVVMVDHVRRRGMPDRLELQRGRGRRRRRRDGVIEDRAAFLPHLVEIRSNEDLGHGCPKWLELVLIRDARDHRRRR
mmetsp:Transcript_20003/g.59884  ORF Transcript_20003/g.59884 Transcript_20003/m.59884 type:complete len:316 (-) Transcript_20003:262-1209(-)